MSDTVSLGCREERRSVTPGSNREVRDSDVSDSVRGETLRDVSVANSQTEELGAHMSSTEYSEADVSSTASQAPCAGNSVVSVRDVSSAPQSDTNVAFVERLKLWALSGVKHKHVTALLKILKTHDCHKDLPSCARSLLSTPRTTTAIKPMCSGQYCHFGLENGLEYTLGACGSIPDVIKINVNIDGLPLTKSTTNQFWPILCRALNCGSSVTPFPIGVYYGTSKALSANTFLGPFVEEYLDLHGTGIEINGKHVHVKIEAIVCDAPAKSYVLAVKGHSGYFSCTKCTTEGDYIDDRVCFPELDALERTDDGFRSRKQEEHHVGNSVLENLPIDMIEQVPLDYMHLVCLGVQKKLLSMWFKGAKGHRLGPAVREIVSISHVSLEPFAPCDFSRRPRTLSELDRWKATEFRMFLLYTGPIVLASTLPKVLYRHFLELHVAISVLVSPRHCTEHTDFADRLLHKFVEKYATLYGPSSVSHNVHGLIHLASSVRTHGPLDLWSAFPFESFMCTLKRYLRKPEKPLEQLHNRILEARCTPPQYADRSLDAVLSIEIRNSAVPSECVPPLYRKVTVPGRFCLQANTRDSTCFLADGSFIEVTGVARSIVNGDVCIVGRRYSDAGNFYTYPCESSFLGIHVISQKSSLTVCPLSSVRMKCARFPHRSNSYVAFSLPHTEFNA